MKKPLRCAIYTRKSSEEGLYQLLSNPVYIGKIRHKENVYDGAHAAIIDQDLWDAVEQQLLVHGPELRRKTRVTDRSLLAGKLFDAGGEPLSPSHSLKQCRRYRYYISRSLDSDPRSVHLNTEQVLVIHSPQLAQQVVSMFDVISASASSYQVIPDADANIVWVTQEDGQQIIYHSDPQTGLWRTITSGIVSALPIDDLL